MVILGTVVLLLLYFNYAETVHVSRPEVQSLVGGVDGRTSGKILITYYGRTGYVCDGGFNRNAAKVVCRTLGFYGELAHVLPTQLVPTYDAGYMHTFRWKIICHGNETELYQCNYTRLASTCKADEGIAIICLQPQRLGDPIAWSLVGGVTRTEGRVQMTYAGYPGSLCIGSEYGNKVATVICRYLGASRPGYVDRAAPVRWFGRGSGLVWISGIFCAGFESTPLMCPHNEIGSTPCTKNGSHELAIQCAAYPLEMSSAYTASTRLSKPLLSSITRTTPIEAASTNANTSTYTGSNKTSTRPMEHSVKLESTTMTTVIPRITRVIHAHTREQSPFLHMSQFQMININSDLHTGVVDMKVARTWHNVCDNYGRFDDKAAQVFCRSIGQPSADARRMYPHSNTLQGYRVISWSVYVRCRGTELSLLSCLHGPINVVECSPEDIVIVTCPSPTETKDDNSKWIGFTLATAALLLIITAGMMVFVAIRRRKRERDQSRALIINEEDIANDYIPPKYEELFPELQTMSQPETSHGASQEPSETTGAREYPQENYM